MIDKFQTLFDEETVSIFVITMQFSLVLFLAIVNFQAMHAFKRRPFLLFGIGWLSNLLYLVASSGVTARVPYMSEHHTWQNFTDTLDCITTGLFLWGAIIGLRGPPSNYSSLRKKLPLLMILVGMSICWNLIAVHTFDQNFYFSFLLAQLPLSLASIIAFSCVTLYLSSLLRSTASKANYFFHPLTLGAFLYTAIQPIHLLTHTEFPWHTISNTIGFSLGLLAKGLILFGLVQLLVTSAAELTRVEMDNESIRRRKEALNDIGHELATPLLELSSHMRNFERILPSRGRQRIYLSAMENATLRLSAILDASKLVPIDQIPDLDSILSQACNPTAYGLHHLAVVNVNTVAQMAAMALKETRVEKVKLHLEYSKKCCLECRPGEIVQILINVMRNAYDSFPDGEGRVWVKTEVGATAAGDMSARVKITIQDNGEGIPKASLEKIFERGFSSRGGPGRGKGLAIAKELATRNRGKIIVSSPSHHSTNGGPGTCVALEFPKVCCDNYLSTSASTETEV